MMPLISYVLGVLLLVFCGNAQGATQVEIDANTGRAIGAQEISPEKLKRKIDQQTRVLIIDVRDAEEFEKETIKDAIHIPLAELENWLKYIPPDTTLAFTWSTGRRSSQAAKLAEHAGFKSAIFCPLKNWKAQGYETTRGKATP